MNSYYLNECIRFIKNKENDKLNDFIYCNCGYIEEIIFKTETNIYDIAIKHNNFEAFNILLAYDYSYLVSLGYDDYYYKDNKCECFSKCFSEESKYFDFKQLKKLLNKGFKPSNIFINLIIKNKGIEGISLLKLIFQYTNFNTDLILKFLKNYYLNKIPLSQSELNKIVHEENEKLNYVLNNNYKNTEATLSILCENRNETLLKFLIENGVDVNAEYELITFEEDEDRGCHRKIKIKTPLITACEYENDLLIKYLIEHGADTNCKYELCEFYIENFYGDDNNEKIKAYPSNHVIKTPLSISCEKGNETIIKYLIEHGANINIECEDEIKSPISIKYEKENEYFLKKICSIIDTDGIESFLKNFNNIYLPLSIACKNQNETLIKYLVDHGANIDSKCRDCNSTLCTPLSIACGIGNELMVKYLIEHGANVNVELNEKNGIYLYTPLSIACERGYESVVKYLIEHGADVNGKCQHSCYHITRGYPPLSSPLSIACYKGNRSIAKYLIEHGANIDGNGGNNNVTPLLFACESNNESIIKDLIEHGANINVKYYDITPLSISSEKGNEYIIKFFIEHGAKC